MTEKKESTEKNGRAHVPFDMMECPAEGCDARGTVPGVQRHWGFKHKEPAPEWPPAHTVAGLAARLQDEPDDRVDALAARFGVTPKKNATLDEIAEEILSKLTPARSR